MNCVAWSRMIISLPATRVLRRALVIVALISVWCALAAISTAHAAINASPATFVPAWGSESESSTLVTWSNPTAGRVRVIVATGTGAVRRVLVDEFQPAGDQQIAWNGSDAAGEPLAKGNYVIRIERATTPSPAPRAQSRGAQKLARGRATARAAAETAIVQLQAAPLAIRTVKLVRGSIGASAARSAIVGTYAVSAPASVAAAIVDGQGRIVRSLQSGSVGMGTSKLTWNGRTAAGKPVADGSYTLLLSAASGGRPTATVRTPVRVDRSAPKLRARKAVRAVSSRVHVVVPLTIALSEQSTVAVRLGRKGTKWQQAAGTKTTKLTGSVLGIAPSRKARTIRVRVTAADATGNLSTRVVAVVVPALSVTRTPQAQKPPSPAPNPTPPPTVTGSGAVAWPLAGQATSEFGFRWGRMHEGIDVGVPIGTPVRAAAAGRISSAGTMGGYGVQITIEHAGGLSTRYAHLFSVATGLVMGDAVAKGQFIGMSGNSGSSTGPHLHFETRINGVAKNPRLFLP